MGYIQGEFSWSDDQQQMFLYFTSCRNWQLYIFWHCIYMELMLLERHWFAVISTQYSLSLWSRSPCTKFSDAIYWVINFFLPVTAVTGGIIFPENGLWDTVSFSFCLQTTCLPVWYVLYLTREPAVYCNYKLRQWMDWYTWCPLWWGRNFRRGWRWGWWWWGRYIISWAIFSKLHCMPLP